MSMAYKRNERHKDELFQCGMDMSGFAWVPESIFSEKGEGNHGMKNASMHNVVIVCGHTNGTHKEEDVIAV